MGVQRLLAATMCVSALITPTLATIYWAGIDESGGEFAPGVLPGTFGVDYAFTNNSAVDIYVKESKVFLPSSNSIIENRIKLLTRDFVLSKVNLFRVAFLLERMCPLEYGLGSKFNETYFKYYKEAIDHITLTRGAYAILDPHNYMRYNDASEQPLSGSVIGNWSDPKAATTQQFGEFWGELASRFRHNEKVIFGLMNEPWGTNTSLVLKNDQAAIDHIRAAGCEQLILAPGNDWAGGHSWFDNGEDSNANVMWKLHDPIHNTAFDIHEYLDVDFSGSHVDCVSDPRIFLSNLTSWLEKHDFKAMITEFGGSNTTGCYDMLKVLVDYMEENPVYIGWSMWAAGT
ncbi:glycoside hydrolase family 5 protein [Penicillium daleae]|uniref:cellulase n=1 Tax=Penicillium daleae TaxID=63821 RepID=A0AAD6G228_9EURO|nr:glycoside hydrolase family 5 protein [Penicillium daleae]KAJ5444506.1 glycoside hydrolase family 5 protein [Penicillium daleae]